MGLEAHSSFAALYSTVSQHIQDLAMQHKLWVILVLDEAHLPHIQVLEQLHMLLNFEKDSKPWLSLILVGCPTCARPSAATSWPLWPPGSRSVCSSPRSTPSRSSSTSATA